MAEHTGGALARFPLRRGWSIREARDDDADALVALVGAAYDEYDGCVMDLDGVDADLGAWASHLRRGDGVGWVVTDRDDIVACVGVAPTGDDQDAVELKRLYVAARARRRGLGAALVHLVEEWARDRRHGRVVLWSDTRFADAHRLYERLGYRRSGAQRLLHDPSDTTESAFGRSLVAPEGR